MFLTMLKSGAALAAAFLVLTGSGLLARQVLAPEADETAAEAGEKAKPSAGPEAAISTRDQLTPETFARFRELIRPGDTELTWRKVRWYTDFWMARQKAAAEDKPILVFWSSDGAGAFDMLGRC